jgi:hypothetical protein
MTPENGRGREGEKSVTQQIAVKIVRIIITLTKRYGQIKLFLGSPYGIAA